MTAFAARVARGTTRRCRPTSDRMRRACGGAPSAARIAARHAPRADAGRSRRCVRRRAGRCGAPTACRPDARIRSGARRWRRSRPIRVCVRIRGGHRIEARARARRGLARSRRRDAGMGIECVAGRRRGARRAHRRCGDPRTIDFGGDAIWRDPPTCPGFRGGFPAGGEDARGVFAAEPAMGDAMRLGIERDNLVPRRACRMRPCWNRARWNRSWTSGP